MRWEIQGRYRMGLTEEERRKLKDHEDLERALYGSGPRPWGRGKFIDPSAVKETAHVEPGESKDGKEAEPRLVPEDAGDEAEE